MELKLIQPWSVPVVKTELPQEVLNTMIEITDLIIDDSNSSSLGNSLAGQIEKELVIDIELLKLTGVMKFFTELMRQFVIICKCQMMPIEKKEIVQKKWISDITRMWVVSQKPNEYNPFHVHGDYKFPCDISSVMYLKVPRMLPSRKKNGSDGHIHFSGNVSRDIKFSLPSVTFSPQVGDFYLFGSHQQHGVYPFRCTNGEKNDERRSVSFNAKIRE